MGKGFDYRGQGALVTLTVPYSTHTLLMDHPPFDLLTTYSHASIEAYDRFYRVL